MSRLNKLQDTYTNSANARNSTVYLADFDPSSSRLFDEFHLDKKVYAAAVKHNLMLHFCCLTEGLKHILKDIKRACKGANAMAMQEEQNEGPVSARVHRNQEWERPHSLGAVEPPMPSEVLSDLLTSLEEAGLNIHGLDESSTTLLTNNVAYLESEREVFAEERRVNVVIYDQLQQQKRRDTGNVFTVDSDEFYKDKGIPFHAEIRRNIRQSSGWRPVLDGTYVGTKPGCPVHAFFPFVNLWGDNVLNQFSLTYIMGEAIIPNISIAHSVLYMSSHIRNTIKGMKPILFPNGTKSKYFEKIEPGTAESEDKIMGDWCTWVDLYVKLEWFILVCRYVIFAHSHVDTYSSDKNSRRILIKAIESLPPILMSDTWVSQTLFSWPPKESNAGDVTVTPSVSVDVLRRSMLVAQGEYSHPVLEIVPGPDRILINRLDNMSAVFCYRILLNRAQDEEDSGTLFLVNTDFVDHNLNSAAVQNPVGRQAGFGVVPIDWNEDVCDQGGSDLGKKSCTDTCLRNPYMLNPIYLYKKLWFLEKHPSEETNAEMQTVFEHVWHLFAPLMYKQGTGGGNMAGDWCCLRMFPCCLTRSSITDVWGKLLPLGIGGTTELDKNISDYCVSMDTKETSTRFSRCNLGEFLKLVDDINSKNLRSSNDAERSLWLTSLWKETVNHAVDLLSHIPL